MNALETNPLKGVLQALGGYVLWGVFPLYFVLLEAVSAGEVLAHRIVGSVVLVAVLFAFVGRFWELKRDLRSAFGTVRRAGFHLAVSALISGNWLIYIWANQNGHVIDASMGYFINPLVSVLLAMVFLGERLRRFQWLAVALAATGVGLMVVRYGSVPWIALGLAFSFGSYGLLRKKAQMPALSGLWIETLLLMPFALVWLAWLGVQGDLGLGQLGWQVDILLLSAGAVTVLPLALFLASMQHLPLITLGVLQYIAPTLQFLIGLWLGEHFGEERWVTFGFIWTALVVFTWEALIESARARR